MLTQSRTLAFRSWNTDLATPVLAALVAAGVCAACSSDNSNGEGSEAGSRNNTSGMLQPDQRESDNTDSASQQSNGQGSDAQGSDAQGSGIQSSGDPNANSQDSASDGLDGDASQTAGNSDSTSDPETPDDTPFVIFEDPITGFRTVNVYDANRELYHFDRDEESMVREAGDIRQSNWLVSGTDVSNNGVFGSYRIRFGTEQGKQRAYFTEVTPPTICDLVLESANALSIYRGSEMPPMN